MPRNQKRIETFDTALQLSKIRLRRLNGVFIPPRDGFGGFDNIVQCFATADQQFSITRSLPPQPLRSSSTRSQAIQSKQIANIEQLLDNLKLLTDAVSDYSRVRRKGGQLVTSELRLCRSKPFRNRCPLSCQDVLHQRLKVLRYKASELFFPTPSTRVRKKTRKINYVAIEGVFKDAPGFLPRIKIKHPFFAKDICQRFFQVGTLK